MEASIAKGIPKAHLIASKKLKAPGIDKAGRVNWSEFEPWYEQHKNDLTTPSDESLTKWKARKTKADALRSELELARLQNRLVDKEDMQQLIRQINSASMAILKSKLCEELTPKLLGLDLVKMNVITRTVFEEVCTLMQSIEISVEEFTNEPAIEE